MEVISLSGVRLAGKTALANIIVDLGNQMGLPFKRVSFATPLKEEFSRVKGVGLKMLSTPGYKEEFRIELIKYGREERAKNPFVFADKLFETLLPTDFWVIDDARYTEEFQRVLEHKGKVYKVEADRKSRELRGWKYDPYVDNDLSETELGWLSASTFQHLGGGVIYNNKTLEDLKKEALKLIRELYSPKIV